MIFFDPDYVQGNDGQQGFAFIKDGQFDTRLNGQPTVGGLHIVRIQAFDGKPGNELPMGKMIAPPYSTAADLPKEDASQDFNIARPGET
ncbi:MAG: hypothetical protein SFU86_14670 [Pirellulaceae bacterium]|nr:hypothetical protein [Pirellulaceae bacterium]